MRVLGIKQVYIDQSGYGLALSLEKAFAKRKAGFAASFLGLSSLLLFFLAVFFEKNKSLSLTMLGSGEIFLGLFFVFLVYYLFSAYLQEDRTFSPEEAQEAWLHEAYGKNLTFFSCQILDAATLNADLLLLHFFNFLLGDARFIWVLRRLNIASEDFAQKIKEKYPGAVSLSLPEILKLAWQKAIASNHLELDYPDLLVAAYKHDKVFQEILFDYGVEDKDLVAVAYWQRRREAARKNAKKFWQRDNLLNIKGIGKDWAGGFTVNLDKVARDLTVETKYTKVPTHLYGRVSEVDLLSRMLIRSQGAGNVVLVGPPGVGRHTVLRSFAARLNAGHTYGPLRYLRILEIDSGSVLAGANSLNEVVDKIQLLFGEAYFAGNVILVIDNIDALFDPSAEAGRVNATEALLPILRSRLRIIGTATQRGYQTTIGKNPQLQQLIGKLEVGELTPAQTLLILEDTVSGVEKQTGVFFSYAALKEIVKLATKLIQNLPNPEKSFEILEETGIYVATKTGDRSVLPAHVQKVVTVRTKIPVEKVAGEEKDILLNLEEVLHRRIIGQHEAIGELADALRRARSGIGSENRPIGSFLFLGPTGVGKTETTKALAAVYFGSEKKIIRFDMSEFQEIHSINRLIGDPDSNTGGLLTEAVITEPFSIVLLDELEKAHPKILDLFLQVFDEGRLTDALGRLVSFTNTMIIATSNAGAEAIRQMVSAGKNPAAAKDELVDALLREGIFRPEFLNRFDAVIVFRPLSEGELAQVAMLLLQELNQRLSEKEVQINITPELAQAIAKGGYSPEFGARPLRRYIQEHIENYIARGLISGEIQRGQVVEVRPEML